MLATGPRVLVVDDQADVREALRLLLKGAGYAIETAASPAEALDAFAYRDHDLIVLDMNFQSDTTSGEEGLALIDRLRGQDKYARIIAMTGWSTVELAVEAMHHGACDFIPKPWDNRHFLSVIDKHLRAEHKDDRVQAELSTARKVQRKLLREPYFSACGLQCECASLCAGEVTGDLYDFFQVSDHEVAFLLGDVSGKGIGAALLVANLQATIRSLDGLAVHPAKLIARVNELFADATRPEHYASLFYAVYDQRFGTLRYVNCGHPSPVLVRNNGGMESLESTCTVLGAFQSLRCDEGKIQLAVDDSVVLFSDGFSEAKLDEEGEDDWAMSCIRLLGRTRRSGLAGLLANRATPDDGALRDDITIMHVRVITA